MTEEAKHSAAVLLIDDDSTVRETVAELLRQKGYAVAAFADAESGLEQMTKNVFQIAVCDYHLPNASGIAFAARARAISPEMPVIMISGVAPPDDALDAVLAGASAFLSKPFLPEELLWLLARAIRLGPQKLAPIIAPASIADAGSATPLGETPPAV